MFLQLLDNELMYHSIDTDPSNLAVLSIRAKNLDLAWDCFCFNWNRYLPTNQLCDLKFWSKRRLCVHTAIRMILNYAFVQITTILKNATRYVRRLIMCMSYKCYGILPITTRFSIFNNSVICPLLFVLPLQIHLVIYVSFPTKIEVSFKVPSKLGATTFERFDFSLML